MRRGRCCCGPVPCKIGIQLTGTCGVAIPPGVAVALTRPDGGVVGSTTADATGYAEFEADEGDYVAVAAKPGWAADPVAFHGVCGVTHYVSITSKGYGAVVTRQCDGMTVAGVTVEIDGDAVPSLATGSDGRIRLSSVPTGASVTFVPPGPRWKSVTKPISSPCGFVGAYDPVALPAADGFRCCAPSLATAGVSGALPRGRLRVVTSSGASYTFDACSNEQIVSSDAVPCGGAVVSKTTSNPPFPDCRYDWFPDMADGVFNLPLRIGITSPPGGGATRWLAVIGYAPAKSFVQYDPMTDHVCRAGAVDYNVSGKNWYDLATQTDGSVNSSVAHAYVYPTVMSDDPLSLRFDFGSAVRSDGSSDGAAWAWNYDYVDQDYYYPAPLPLKWATLTEELP